MDQLVPSSTTFCIRLFIEPDPSGRTRCKSCSLPILKSTPRVSFYRSMVKSYFFHLHCFTPVTHVRIDHRTLRFRATEDDIATETEAWITTWNQQFDLNPAVLDRYTVKRLRTDPPADRRVLLEAFKFVGVPGIAGAIALVNKGWYHVAWEEELWRVLCSALHIDGKHTAEYRKSVVAHWLTMCVHCTAQLDREKRYMVCPVTSRPKCAECYRKKENRPHRLAWMEEEYQVSERLVNKLAVHVFGFDGVKCVYPFETLGKAGKHRKTTAGEVCKAKNDALRTVFSQNWLKKLKSATETDFFSFSSLELFFNSAFSDNQSKFLLFLLSGKSLRAFDSFFSSLSP